MAIYGINQCRAAALIMLALVGCSSTGRGTRATDGVISNIANTADGPIDLTDANKADVRMALAKTLENQGHMEKALAEYISVGETCRSAPAFHRAAILNERLGKPREAHQFLERALELEPDNAVLLSDAGYSRYLSDEFGPSEQLLRRAAAMRPGYQKAHLNLGMLLARTDRIDEAMVEFFHGGCSQSDALTNLAMALIHNGNVQQAGEYLETALHQEPRHPSAERLMASLLNAQPITDPTVNRQIGLASHYEQEVENAALNVTDRGKYGDR